jgi:hypothetical protein
MKNSMQVLRSGNWVKTWTFDDGRYDFTTYYRKADVEAALQKYGYTGAERPETVLTQSTDAAYLIQRTVEPYRLAYLPQRKPK